MATVIYEQERQDSPASAVGGIVGALLGRQIRDDERKQRAEKSNKFMTDIQGAGSRARALDILSNYSNQFENVNDYNVAFKVVDQFWPAPTREVRDVTVYDKLSGAETRHFVPGAELPALSNPEELARRFGPNATLTRPDIREFYTGDQGEISYAGRRPVDQRQPGEFTLPELQERNRQRQFERSEQRDQFSRERYEGWMSLAERRFAAAMQGIGNALGAREMSAGRAALNDATRLTATSLNARLLPDGSFGFDDENKAKLFNDRLTYMQNLIDQDPTILLKPGGSLHLHSAANKAFPSARENPPAPAPAAKPKAGGKLSALIDGVLGRDGQPSPKPAAKPAPAGAPTRENAELKSKVEATGWKWEPEKYNYRIGPNGRPQRSPR